MTDHVDPPWEPPLAGTEVEHLVGALDRQRWTFRWKADGLDAEALGFRLPSSSLSLGALLDRLTHHVHILAMNGESYRLRHSKQRRQDASTDQPPV